MSEEWVRFGLSDAGAEQYKVLVDAVPDRLREPLIAWLQPVLTPSEYGYVVSPRTRKLEMMTDVPIGLSAETSSRWHMYSPRLRKLDGGSLLSIIDAALAARSGVRTGELNSSLATGRSRWRVERLGKPGLVARVPEGVQDAVEATITSSGTAGQILARAWGKVHGLNPDDPGAYPDAVRAVEIAAHKLVQPDKHEATLGGMAGVMRDQGGAVVPQQPSLQAENA